MSRSNDGSTDNEPRTLLVPFVGGAAMGLAIFLVAAAMMTDERESRSTKVTLPAIVVEGAATNPFEDDGDQDSRVPVLSNARPRAPENAQGDAPAASPRQDAPSSAPPSTRPRSGGKYANGGAERGQPIAKADAPPAPVVK